MIVTVTVKSFIVLVPDSPLGYGLDQPLGLGVSRKGRPPTFPAGGGQEGLALGLGLVLLEDV